VIDNELIAEFIERFKDIPFGQSAYQNEQFIIKNQLTDPRAYRSIGLELETRIKAYQKAFYQNQRNVIKIEQLKQKIELENCVLQKRLIEIDITELEEERIFLGKHVADLFVEIEQFKSAMKNFPKITREQFERSEELYFTKSLKEQLVDKPDALKQLEKITPVEQTETKVGLTASELLKEHYGV
jgi:tetratricopeptide (TPR) repeat protein